MIRMSEFTLAAELKDDENKRRTEILSHNKNVARKERGSRLRASGHVGMITDNRRNPGKKYSEGGGGVGSLVEPQPIHQKTGDSFLLDTKESQRHAYRASAGGRLSGPEGDRDDSSVLFGEALAVGSTVTRLHNFRASRKTQIRSWFRNHTRSQRESGMVAAKKSDPGSLAAALWKDQTRQRNPQLVELYQKLYPDRVREGLDVTGFNAKHSDDLDFVSLDGERPAAEVKRRLSAEASARLSARRAVSRTLLAEETDEVKQELEDELNKIKQLKLEGKTEEKLTPESAQRSLDQLEGIIDRFHQILREKTGWVGFTLVGGPTPNAGGALSMQVFSSGLTPAGHTFKQVHPDWKGAVSVNFTQFLKRCFTRSERDAMALPEADDLDDLLQMSDEEQEEAPSPPPKFVAPKRKPAKKKDTTALAPSSAPPQPQTHTSVPPAPLAPDTSSSDGSPASPAAPESNEQMLPSSFIADLSSWNTNKFDWNTFDGIMDSGIDFSPEEPFDDSAVELEPVGLPQELTAEELERLIDAAEPWSRDGSVLKTRWWLNASTEETNVLRPDTNAADTRFFSGTGPDLSGMQGTNPNGGPAFAPAQASQRPSAPSPTPPAPSSTHPVPPPSEPSPTPLARSTARSRIAMATTSPLPPRMMRTASSSTAAIASSTAALSAAMVNSRTQAEEDTDNSDSDDMPLAHREAPNSGTDAGGEGSKVEEEIPLSRPMANVPKPAGTRGRGAVQGAARGGAAGGARGGEAGGARGGEAGGARGGAAGGARGGEAGGARGGEAGGTRGGARGAAADGGRRAEELRSSGRRRGSGQRGRGLQVQGEVVDCGEAGSAGRGRGRGRGRAGDGGMQGGDGGSDGGEADRGGGGSQGERPTPKPLYRFRQTYADNGEVIPLPLDAPTGRVPHDRMKEIRAFERGQGKKEKTKAKKPPEPGVWCLPRPAGAPMPPIPKLGPPGRFNKERENAKQEAASGLGRGGRQKRAPKNPNEEADLLEARVREAKGKKRKMDENEDVGADSPRLVILFFALRAETKAATQTVEERPYITLHGAVGSAAASLNLRYLTREEKKHGKKRFFIQSKGTIRVSGASGSEVPRGRGAVDGVVRGGGTRVQALRGGGVQNRGWRTRRGSDSLIIGGAHGGELPRGRGAVDGVVRGGGTPVQALWGGGCKIEGGGHVRMWARSLEDEEPSKGYWGRRNPGASGAGRGVQNPTVRMGARSLEDEEPSMGYWGQRNPGASGAEAVDGVVRAREPGCKRRGAGGAELTGVVGKANGRAGRRCKQSDQEQCASKFEPKRGTRGLERGEAGLRDARSSQREGKGRNGAGAHAHLAQFGTTCGVRPKCHTNAEGLGSELAPRKQVKSTQNGKYSHPARALRAPTTKPRDNAAAGSATANAPLPAKNGNCSKAIHRRASHGSRYPWSLPRLLFTDMSFPQLISLTLHQFALVPFFPESDVVAFILRHKATLTHIELQSCSINGGHDGVFPRPWFAVFTLFQAELACLREFVFENEVFPDEYGFQRDVQFEYTSMDPGFGYVP
ncbi:hypothetical protein C8F04DRAFT_1238364 [Mycena alexandri]|uniref:Uncharacterized protein n=1 Tax=Mycena alexandri TaxID=1745969 RepID=A0AAD6SHF8_9AGAR|nr:hypothetical protein C8F04DRAFT_1238364 [Mycena alexandri]